MEPTRTTQGLQMLTFFKKQPSASDEKEQAKALFQKIVSATSESHEIRKIKLGLSLLCQAHLDSSFIAGAEQTATYLDGVTKAIVKGEDKPELPEAEEFIKIKRGDKFIWVYLPQEYADQAFELGSQYQQTKINAHQAVDSMQLLADQLSYDALKLNPPFVALQFLWDELGAENTPETHQDSEKV